MAQDWFASWFDTPYYHTLYNHRDNTEAKLFIDKLFAYLKPKPGATILDLACGRGRHAIYMNQKGFSVTGVDLSDENIAFARAFENELLHFEVNDMRKSMGINRFDYVFNLFTSFGYFDEEHEDEMAMQHISACLRPGGTLILDFMNTPKVAQHLVPQEVKVAEGIAFHINRYVEGEQIVKEITFTADGNPWRFEERVKKYTLHDFNLLFKGAGLQPVMYFGSLDLQPYDAEKSDRLIMIVQKP